MPSQYFICDRVLVPRALANERGPGLPVTARSEVAADVATPDEGDQRKTVVILYFGAAGCHHIESRPSLGTLRSKLLARRPSATQATKSSRTRAR